MQAANDYRNTVLSEEELNDFLPSEEYEIVIAPENYVRNEELLKVLAEHCKSSGAFEKQYKKQEYEDLTMLPAFPSVLMSDLKLTPNDYEYFSELFQKLKPSKLSKKKLRSIKLKLLLLKIKCGSGLLRRTSKKAFLTFANEQKALDIAVSELFNLIVSTNDRLVERFELYDLVLSLIKSQSNAFKQYAGEFYKISYNSFSAKEAPLQVKIKLIWSELVRYVPIGEFIPLIRPDIDHPLDEFRMASSTLCAIYAKNNSVLDIISFIRALLRLQNNEHGIINGINIINNMAYVFRRAIIPYLHVLVDSLTKCLKRNSMKVRLVVCHAISSCAKVVKPFAAEAFRPILPILWVQIRHLAEKRFATYAKAILSIVELFLEDEAAVCTKEFLKLAMKHCNSTDFDTKLAILFIVSKACNCKVLNSDNIEKEVFADLFPNFLCPGIMGNVRLEKTIISTFLAIQKCCDTSIILLNLLPFLKHNDSGTRCLTLGVAHALLTSNEVVDIDDKICDKVFEDFLYCMQNETMCVNNENVLAVTALLNIKDYFLKKFINEIVELLHWKLNHSSETFQIESALCFARITKKLKQLGYSAVISSFKSYYIEYITINSPVVLAAILQAINAAYQQIHNEEGSMSIPDLVPLLTPVLQITNIDVQFAVVELLGTLVELDGDSVDPKELDRIANQLLMLFYVKNKQLRNIAIRIFGVIAECIGPHEIILTLLNNLRAVERQVRICTTIAIAEVAWRCEPYSVLAALMNEYQ